MTSPLWQGPNPNVPWCCSSLSCSPSSVPVLLCSEPWVVLLFIHRTQSSATNSQGCNTETSGAPLCMGPYVWCFTLQIPAISADSNFNLGLLSSMRPPCSSQMPLSGNCPQAESWTIMRLTSGFLCSLDRSVMPAVVQYLEIVASYILSSFIVDFGMRSSLVSGIVVWPGAEIYSLIIFISLVHISI